MILSAINKKITSHKKKKQRNQTESVRTRGYFLLVFPFDKFFFFFANEKANFMFFV